MDKTKESKAEKKKKSKVKVFTKKKKAPISQDVVIEKLKSQYESIDTSKLINKTKDGKAEKKKKSKVKVFTKKKKAPISEDVLIEKLKSQYESIDTSKLTKFTDFPLSHRTIKGLKESKYYNLTDIQRESIGLALKGNDVLGAAQTGSGKTLAFLVPILERLYCEKWTRIDGVGALVITPTRELAYQIFETLRKIGKYQDFSAGLIIGGKDLKFERRRMDQCNIVICTPGRLLQHMDENPLFDCVNMKILVLDEADRCLDMGFKPTMNAIIANLPVQRQTLLFSATQTKSVQDLARLSLKDASYVSVHEMTTPKGLQQSYVVCQLQDKLPNLWSFVRNHLKHKTIIFFSTCKQVKYFYEMFCKLRPGLSLLPLYGTLHQLRRMKIYEEFCRKQSAVLFATDLAARGLDFPEVHWVVQADCPEDVETYIHRVGRTARYHKGGESLLLLMPSELKMLDYFEEKKIPIEKIDINPAKLQNPVRKMEALLVKDLTLKDTAQRAVTHYARAIYFMKHKEIFDVQALDFDSFSKSLGLNVPPRIRFLARMNKKQQIMNNEVSKKFQVHEMEDGVNKKVYFDNDKSDQDNIDIGNTQSKKAEKPTRDKEESSSEDSGVLESDDDGHTASKPLKNSSLNFGVPDSDSEDDLLLAKRRDHDIETPKDLQPIEGFLGQNRKKKPITKAAVVKKMLKKNIVPNKKILFDDEGAALVQGVKERTSALAREFENEDEGGIDIEKAKLVLKEEDKFDKQMFKAKVKAKHKEERRKLKEQKRAEEGGERDDFGESDSDEGPDLSWLPDPDKVYGEKEDSGDNMEDNAISNESDDQTEVIDKKKKQKKAKKRKAKDMDNLETVLKRKKKHKIEQLSADLNVNETEELVLMLLKGKK